MYAFDFPLYYTLVDVFNNDESISKLINPKHSYVAKNSKYAVTFVANHDTDKDEFVPSIIEAGFEIVATSGTAQYIEALGYKVEKVNKVMEGRPHIVDSILNNDIDLIINTTEGSQSIRDSASIRQSALRNKIFCTTTMFGAFAIIDALQGSENDWTYTTLQELNK